MTTIQHVIRSIINNPNINISADRVRYGWSDVLNITEGNPFISVSDYHDETDYATNGPSTKVSTFRLHVVAWSLEEAEATFGHIDTNFNVTAPTPQAGAVFRKTYDIDALPIEQSYRYHVYGDYELHEDLTA